MAFMKVNASEDVVKDSTGGNFITQSGIYEVLIKSVIVDESEKGSMSLHLFFEYNGQEQIIYNAIRITNNDGSENFGAGLLQRLSVINGAKDGDEIPDPVSRMLPIGEKGAEKECMVLDVFDDVPCFIRVQMEYSMYEGKMQSRKNLRQIFRFEDKATANEIVNILAGAEGVVAGSQYEKELEYADKDKYKDVTEEDVAEWKKNRRSGKKEESASKKPSGGFGGKRFGKK